MIIIHIILSQFGKERKKTFLRLVLFSLYVDNKKKVSYGLREKKKDKNVVKKHRKMAIFSVCFSYTFLVLGIWVLMSFLVCVCVCEISVS